MRAKLAQFGSRSHLNILGFCCFSDGDIHLKHQATERHKCLCLAENALLQPFFLSEPDRKDWERLTVHIQAVVSDPFLPTQGLVARFAAQCRAIVFPFHWDTNGVGHAERLAIILLRHSTWTERKSMI